jgi:hypothetical protein
MGMLIENGESKRIVYDPIANGNTERISQLAKSLCEQYHNHPYYKWYCKVIYELGIERVLLIQARASDSKQPGKLFTKIANEELAVKLNLQKRRDG